VQTIRNSQSLNKDASSVVNAAQEFLQNSYVGFKNRNITKEKTITEAKTQQSSVETNITVRFHRFLAMG